MSNFDPSAYMATGTESGTSPVKRPITPLDVCWIAAISAVCGAGISWLAFMVAVL